MLVFNSLTIKFEEAYGGIDFLLPRTTCWKKSIENSEVHHNISSDIECSHTVLNKLDMKLCQDMFNAMFCIMGC